MILDTPESTATPERVQELARNGYQLNISDAISRGFKTFQAYPGGFIGFFLLSGLMMGVSSFIPFAGILISGPLTVGNWLVARKIQRGEPYEFGDFFGGFNYFVQLLLASLIVGIFVAIGFIFLIIPGIYLAVAYGWTNMFVTFHKYEFWPAMEASRTVITKNWWNVFAFFIVVFLVNILGLLALGIGLLVTVPATTIAIYHLFEQVFPTEGEVKKPADTVSFA